MISHRHVKKYLHKHIQCQTCFGTFHGVIIHCTKHHIVLGSVGFDRADDEGYPVRPYPMMGPGPGGPGPGGPGWGGGGPWSIAIPIAAIIGITAVGMHW